jgi:hypothetical protein
LRNHWEWEARNEEVSKKKKKKISDQKGIFCKYAQIETPPPACFPNACGI